MAGPGMTGGRTADYSPAKSADAQAFRQSTAEKKAPSQRCFFSMLTRLD